MDKIFTSYTVEERSLVSYVKREIHHEVAAARFSEKRTHEIDIVVSEIMSNVMKHAGGGQVLYRIMDGDPSPTFEIVCIDSGPGMSDVARFKRDGISTTNTLGHGLGAIERLSTVSQVYSLPGWGTIVYARVNGEAPPPEGVSAMRGLDIRGLCVTKPRESVSGDGYSIKRTPTGIQIFFGDGLGHGPGAKEAVDRAKERFMSTYALDPVDMLRQLHDGVRRTRGLVASVATWDRKESAWSLCGVGNITVRVFNGILYKNYMSYNGTVGLNIPKSMKASAIPAERNQHLIMCSDGLRSRWELSRYPSILKYDGNILAAALYKDFTRGNDDASILIAKVM